MAALGEPCEDFSMQPEKNHSVCCPAESCGDVFEVPSVRLGRNVYCPSCGVRMTARPLEIEPQLRARQRELAGGAGATVQRLPFSVVVDNVRSLWNVGSIFRTADACGVERLILTGITGCPPQPRIAKTALGAEQAVAWEYRADTLDALAEISGQGFTPVVIETSGHAVSIDEVEWPERVCLVVGNEVAGVTPQLLEACPCHVSIPMLGVKESFNVAVAFGIAAYHVARSLRLRKGEGASWKPCRS